MWESVDHEIMRQFDSQKYYAAETFFSAHSAGGIIATSRACFSVFPN